MKKLIVSCLSILLCIVLAFGNMTLAAFSRPVAKSSGSAQVRAKARTTKKNYSGASQTSLIRAGQTSTVLPDGRTLLVGGVGPDGPVKTVTIWDPIAEAVIQVPDGIKFARAGHSATMLPDGRVLILGGLGKNNKLVATAECFDTETQKISSWPASGLKPRAYHTATLLTDGRLLITGGINHLGDATNSVELWDFRTKSSSTLDLGLIVTRQKHVATLLPNGSVLLWGGVDESGVTRANGDLFDPFTQTAGWTNTQAPSSSGETPRLEASLPASGATAVAIDPLLSLRFSKQISPKTINSSTVVLLGPQGPVPIRVVPAEAGMLAFITPTAYLSYNAVYTLTATGLLDEMDRQLPVVEVTFTTPNDPAQNSLSQNNDDWTPSGDNYRGDWRSKHVRSAAQDLPALQAPPGVTALAGQVLQLNGEPLANVTLQARNVNTQTDATGRFLLSSLPSGHCVLKIDGTSANSSGTTYGVFRVGVEIQPAQTNVLSFTIWMPKLDMAHAVNIQSPTTRETIITSPRIPGLELRLPVQTVIRDLEGQTVTKLSITPIPTDQPPFPLPPGIDVPVFFTIQPGGSQIIPPRAQLIYPNYTKAAPGTRIDFWNYDPEARGWYIYGRGTVNANGRQVIPDPGVVLYEFSGAMINSPGYNPPPGGPPAGNPPGRGGDPCTPATGPFVNGSPDLYLEDTLPLTLVRTYRQGDSVSRPFGIGTTHFYEMFLWSANQYQEADLILSDGARIHYVRTSPGTGYADAVFEHTASPTEFYKSQMTWNGNGWNVRLRDGTVFVFGENAPLNAIRDRFGNQITITRAGVNGFGSPTGNITRVSSPNGRWITLSYDINNRVMQAKDNSGRIVSYSYDPSGRLSSVTDPIQGVKIYTYDSSHRMLTVRNARGNTLLTNVYDANGRVSRQTQIDNTTFLYAYTTDANGKVTQTDLTTPRGFVRRVNFNSDGYVTSNTYALGRPEQQTISLEREPGTNRITAAVDGLGHRTSYVYDSLGNVTSITRLSGTANAVTVTLTYEPQYSNLTSMNDPLGHSLFYEYDVRGNMVRESNSLGNQATYSYNSAGLPISATDSLNNTTFFTYDGGDLTEARDPLNRSVKWFADGAGRVLTMTDPVGNVTKYKYDALNSLLEMKDSLQGTTSYTYDGAGNLETVTDPRGNISRFTYDGMDRVTSVRDPLLHDETYLYDEDGNLKRVIDRKGQITNLTYDALNRLTGATFADASTIAYTYDNGNRLRQVNDSVSGNLIANYDDLDRLISKTTPQGTISYTYDNGSRMQSMTVAGQATVNYTYDSANRVTGISKGTTSIGIGYDAMGKRSSVSLPNTLSTQFTYDAASQLTAITYKKGTATLGDLSYAYNNNGQLKQMGGSYALSGLPQALSSATYNADNQQITFAGRTFTYDLNGNLTSDGIKTYTWNARDQLVGVSGPGFNVSFQYDGMGSLVSRTVNGSTTAYLTDGPNIVQEQFTGGSTANSIGGYSDEIFTRDDSTGSRRLFPDARGSKIGLLDTDGAVQTEYTYDPFGNTTTSGSASSNPSQFVGQNSEPLSNLYDFDTSNSPEFGRFVTADPDALSTGGNQYSYGGNNFISIAGSGLTGFGGGLLFANAFQNRPTLGGQSRLGFPAQNTWKWARTFHLDFNEEFGYPFNMDVGPLQGTHIGVPGWLAKLGSVKNMRLIGRASLGLGLLLNGIDIATSAPGADRNRAIGGTIGGWAGGFIGGLIGSALLPGLGTVLGGAIGGIIGSMIGGSIGRR